MSLRLNQYKSNPRTPTCTHSDSKGLKRTGRDSSPLHFGSTLGTYVFFARLIFSHRTCFELWSASTWRDLINPEVRRVESFVRDQHDNIVLIGDLKHLGLARGRQAASKSGCVINSGARYENNIVANGHLKNLGRARERQAA